MGVAMVSHCDSWHAKLGCFRNEGFDSSRPIEHRILGVVVQMNKRLI
jgi:hypothetical protein